MVSGSRWLARVPVRAGGVQQLGYSMHKKEKAAFKGKAERGVI